MAKHEHGGVVKRTREALISTLLLSLPLALLAQTDDALRVSDATLLAFNKALGESTVPRERVERMMKLVWVDKPPGELLRFAQAMLEIEARTAPDAVAAAYLSGDLAVRREAIALMQRHWAELTTGSNPTWNSFLVEALVDPDPQIHRTAARIAATNKIERIANAAIDAAIADPKLKTAALAAIAAAGDTTGVRWTIEQLIDKELAVRAAAQYTIYRLGSSCLPLLRARLQESDPAAQRMALEGLLLVATPDDRPALLRWLEKPTDAALVERVTKAVAALETGRLRPPPPAPPVLLP